jgi:hypothetical protein
MNSMLKADKAVIAVNLNFIRNKFGLIAGLREESKGNS